jgi:hypothetical protein
MENISFTIDILNHRTQRMFSLCRIYPKVELSPDIVSFLLSSFHSQLHLLLTHSSQDDIPPPDSFCTIVYQHILQTVQSVALFFAEDANVIFDANLHYYGPDALQLHYLSKLELLIGTYLPSPILSPILSPLLPQQPISWSWQFYPFHLEQVQHIIDILRQSHILI